MIKKLKPEELRRTIDPKSLGIETTNDVKINGEEFVIIGQDSALGALRIAMDMDDIHENIFVAGPDEIGKTTVVKYFLKQNYANKYPTPDDLCYIFNFSEPDKPLAVFLPAGQGKLLEKEMNEFWGRFINDLQTNKSGHYKQVINSLFKSVDDVATLQRQALTEEAEQRGFQFIERPSDTDNAVYIDIKPITEEAKQDEATLQELFQRIEDIDEAKNKAYSEANNKAVELSEEVFRIVLETNMAVFNEFESDKLKKILKNNQDFLLNQFILFFISEPPTQFESLFECNLFVDNLEMQGMPIIQAFNCNCCQMLGYAAKEVTSAGILTTNLKLMKAGKCHKARGGVLIVRVNDLLTYEGYHYVWPQIKEFIRSNEIGIPEIHSPELVIKTIHPEKVPFRVKIILVGSYYQYELLAEHDDQFKRLFQKKVELDYEVDFSDATVNDYLKYITIYSRKSNLLPVNNEAAARIIEYGLELNENQNALSLKFNAIRELLREANTYAKKENKDIVDLSNVENFIRAKKARSSFFERKKREAIKDKILKIDTSGRVIGQINGLVVQIWEDCEFGMPARITATSFAGNGKVFSIDREVKMAGPIHNKASYIIESYIKSQYGEAQELPLSFSICFEQNYGGIEGDSASLAKTLVVQSELAQAPIYQGVAAITGSMNQKGRVQPIGGVNTKIRGWYLTCKENGGLTGEQGVIIPESNISDLMLDKEIVEAVGHGNFHIYTIENIKEAIEITMKLSLEQFYEKISRRLALLKREKRTSGDKNKE